MHLFDTESLARALALPLDATLRRLLRERVDHLATLDRAVADATYFLVVGLGCTAADVEEELGWNPLVDLDGERFGTEAFRSFHDFAADRDGWFELMYSNSNESVIVLFVKDGPPTNNEWLALCHDAVENR